MWFSSFFSTITLKIVNTFGRMFRSFWIYFWVLRLFYKFCILHGIFAEYSKGETWFFYSKHSVLALLSQLHHINCPGAYSSRSRWPAVSTNEGTTVLKSSVRKIKPTKTLYLTSLKHSSRIPEFISAVWLAFVLINATHLIIQLSLDIPCSGVCWRLVHIVFKDSKFHDGP